MVSADKVGKAVDPGFYTCSAPDSVEATWLSTSRIQLLITKEIPLYSLLKISTPANLKGLNGEIIAAGSEAFPCYLSYPAGTTTLDNGSIVIYNRYRDNANALNDRIAGLYALDGNTRIPLTYRPVTAGDFLTFNEDSYYFPSKEELEKLPADEVIPGYWLLENPGQPTQNTGLRIMLPESSWNYRSKSFTDWNLHTISAHPCDYELECNFKSPGKYEVTLNFQMPAAGTIEEILRSLNWQINIPNQKTENDDDEEEVETPQPQPLTWQDGALRGEVEGHPIVLHVTGSKTTQLRLCNGETREGIQSITFSVDSPHAEPRLHCSGSYPTIATPAPRRSWQSTTPQSATILQAPEPYIYTDVTANHLQLRGSTSLQCKYGNLANGKARIYKLSSATRDAVRLLQAYTLRYKNRGYTEDGNEERKSAGLEDDVLADNRVDTTNLPGVVAVATQELTPMKEDKLTLPLAKLFPEQPVGGLYFVDIEGESLRLNKAPAINQGLVQVTDLGLMWKTNGRNLFAWAYSLSTAQEIPAGTLRLYNATGVELAAYPVINGIAEGEFQPGTRYLQLVTNDDCVTLPHNAKNIDNWHDNSWENSRLMAQGISPGDIPTPLVYLFSDRSIYRPGETAHVKGIARWVLHNKLSTMDIESATATIKQGYKTVATVPVTLEADGTFSLDVPMGGVGVHSASISVTLKGDADNSSPDRAFRAANPGAEEYTQSTREFSIELPCKEFRRNEFEVTSTMKVQPEEHRVVIDASATNLTTTPVAHGQVEWSLDIAKADFRPKQEQWSDFRFADYRTNPWRYYYAEYGMDDDADDTSYLHHNSALDAEGKGSHTFTLPESEFPTLRRLTSTTTVTNGNEQSIRSVQKASLHPADVYVGIRSRSPLAKVGGTLPVELVAVKPDGNAWDGAPLAATVEVTRKVFRPYRYRTLSSTSVRNSEEESEPQRIEVSLTGTAQEVQVPISEAGQYDIVVRGKDATGRPFASATRHYVWGDDVSPWEYLDHYELRLVKDKPLYQPGDTAKILVQTPVDAELLVTLERESILRVYRRKVTVDNPVIEVPIEADDAPVVYLSVSLVQSDTRRNGDGKPQIKLGTTTLHIDAPEKKLAVRLEAPAKALLPGAPCTVSGTITDAAGNPVPNANVTLYAEDEGTLQVMGYKLPAPATYFYSEEGREHRVEQYSGLGHLVSENLRNRYLGNKGVFIGGGDDMEEEMDEIADDSATYMRKNFAPCALWLSSVSTDAQGRFTTTYSNPDTLTRYRLMAVASAGDKFGAGESSYLVNKPVMLEPIAPMSACKGDELLLPVTISMLPDQLPAGTGNDITWQVSLSGQNVGITNPTQTVTLSGKQPVTLHFPVTIQDAAPTQLQWHVQPADAPQGSPLAQVKDAVQLSFDAVPPTPYRREYIWQELQSGSTSTLADWITTPYRKGTPVQLTFSSSPLAGLGYGMQYLFTYPYGCTEQLSSTVMPWLFRDELQSLMGISYPKDKKPELIISEVKNKLRKRQLKDYTFGYWDGDTTTSEYSPYAVLVLHMMGESTYREQNALRKQIKNGTGNYYLSLMVLALCNNIYKDDLEAALEHADKPGTLLSQQEKWILAYCAAHRHHPRAAELLQQAKSPEHNQSSRAFYALPPTQALRALYAIASSPSSAATQRLLRDYARQSMGYNSTWNNAWLALCSYAYYKRPVQEAHNATINGQPITLRTPMQVNTTVGDTQSWRTKGSTIYVSGYAEGYVTEEQAMQAVDEGFRVQRRYEQLQADGSWKPTGTFRVGDIVRITVDVHPTTDEQLRYLVLEDRLPSAFEVIDPELGSQALPHGIRTEQLRSWYYCPNNVNNCEYLKDRVRAFANYYWGSRSFRMSYVARVVRSGKVTAPAAKAELMYSTEVYGLSIPQQFDVQSR